MAVSGFKPPGSLSEALFITPLETQTLLVTGKNDILVTEERSRTLEEISKNKRVEVHDGGGFIFSLSIFLRGLSYLPPVTVATQTCP